MPRSHLKSELCRSSPRSKRVSRRSNTFSVFFAICSSMATRASISNSCCRSAERRKTRLRGNHRKRGHLAPKTTRIDCVFTMPQPILSIYQPRSTQPKYPRANIGAAMPIAQIPAQPKWVRTGLVRADPRAPPQKNMAMKMPLSRERMVGASP